MTLEETLRSVWRQIMVENKPEIEVEGRRYPACSTRAKKLRTVEFSFGDARLTGIEQNPETASRWAALARSGQRILQFSCQGRYFANVAEGKLTRYGAWESLGLPK
jgi:hypothetical protein